MKSLLLIGLGILLIGALVRWRLPQTQTKAPENKLNIIASSYPTAFLAEQIGGEKVNVINLTPAGAEPHDFEPTPADIVQIENSQLVLLIGAGFEPWSANLDTSLQNQVRIVTMVEDSVEDPHLWLDPVGYQQWAKLVYQVLREVDPGNEEQYLANLGRFISQAGELDAVFAAGLSSCKRSDIITSHDAFAHLANRYGLVQKPVAGLSPEEEPSPRTLAQITQFARENNVTHIFFETLVSPRLAETIASEVGAQTLVLNPLEGLTEEEILSGENYFSVQRTNLENLRVALDCK